MHFGGALNVIHSGSGRERETAEKSTVTKYREEKCRRS
jgi:hypothetical protein